MTTSPGPEPRPERRRHLVRRLLILPPVLAGLAVLALLMHDRPLPEAAERTGTARPVRVIEVPEVAVVPRAVGYGVVEPARVWTGIAEVGGVVVETHPELARGALLPAGTVLLRLDPADYELAIARIEAQRAGTLAQLEELAIQEENTRRALAIEEEEALAVVTQDLERKRRLLERGSAAQATVDQAVNAVLAQRQRVQAQRSALALFPAQRQGVRAALAQQEVQLAEARRDLARTTLRLPFLGRISMVQVETGQYAAPGTTLVGADAVDVAEVAAQLPLDRMRALLTGQTVRLRPDDGGAVPDPASLGLDAVVRLRAAGLTAAWPARFARIGDAVDPKTRTVEVVVAVDEPYAQAVPGIRPPLAKGMFVEVELRGRPGPPVPVVPRAALHPGPVVHVVGPDDRLEIRPVEIGTRHDGFVTIARGLDPGERVVVSDLIPAIAGMALAPVSDAETLRSLLAAANGGDAS